MKKLLTPLILISLFAGAKPAEAKEYPPRWVEMELGEVEGATAYELQFKSPSGKTANFKTETIDWKAKIRPGQYEVRLRSYDGRGVPGEWSEYMPITIAFPGPQMLEPKLNQKIATGEEKEEDVDFKWEKLNGVAYYRIEVTDGSKTWTKTTDDTEVEFTLPVAREYTWNVFAMQSKEDKGEGSDESHKFVLLGEKLEEPEVIPPIDKYVTEIGWKPVERAQSYTYILSRKSESGKWQKIGRGQNLTDTKVPIAEDIPGGDFRLQVRADAKNVVSSNIKKYEFDIFVGSRDPASVNQNRLKESIEKPTPWYFIASYLLTSASYEGVDNENTSNVRFDGAIAGTGRLGLGYIKPKSDWGGFAILDYGGFDLKGEIKQFASIEGHATWKKYFGPSQLRASGGLFMKELMEGTPVPAGSNNYEFRKVTYYGPHIGFDYWTPISPKYGYQVNGRFYLGMFGDTPNGNDIVATPSYQLGFMGSMKLTKDVMGFAGYAYRRDAISYEAGGAAAGQTQDAALLGHYINLLLEVGF